ncbi:MAG: TldD/PmbA family protein [Elusimicrobia bacterium]|nr:TldD/PmbA family protein [Elusimicrobiota bacterium]
MGRPGGRTVFPAVRGLEVYIEESRRRTLRWEDGRLEESSDASVAGVGLRTLGKTVRFASMEARRPLSQGFTATEVCRLLSHANNIMKGKSFGSRAVSIPALSPAGAGGAGMSFVSETKSLEKKLKWLALAEKAARTDRRIRQVRLTLGELTKKSAGLTPEGRSFSENRHYVSFIVQVTAEEGKLRQSGYEVMAVQGGWDGLSNADPVLLASRASARALSKLLAPPAPLGEKTVVISAEAGGTLIHEAVGHSLEADAVFEGSSPSFAHKVGKVVAGEKISVLDDPTRPGQRGSFVYDDEGTPAERTVLIENGILRTSL